MKLMSYNILNGGSGAGDDRFELLIDTVERESPDILGLNECNDFWTSDRKRLAQFGDALGMTGVLNEAESGNHVAIFHGPGVDVIEASHRSMSMYNGCVFITISTDALGPVMIVATHLHPYSATFRSGEMEIVLARAAKARHAIIMGDMNAVAGSDVPIDFSDAPETLVERLRGVTGAIDTQVISIPLSRGYIDLGSTEAAVTYPTRLSEERLDPRVRLDYMFATPELAARCGAFRVDSSPTAHAASDHLPVIAEFDVSRPA